MASFTKYEILHGVQGSTDYSEKEDYYEEQKK